MENVSEPVWDEGPGLVEAARSYWWLLVVLTVLGGGAGYALSYTQPVVYEADANLLLSDPDERALFETGASFQDPERYVRNQEERIKSRVVAVGASRLLDEAVSPDEIQDSIKVSSQIENDLVTVTATSENPQRAANIANAVGTAYQNDVQEQVQQQADRAIAELDAQITDLRARLDALDERIAEDPDNSALQAQRDALVTQVATLDGQRNQLVVDARLYGRGVELFERADVPTRPAGPQRIRLGAVGGIFGLVLAVALSWWLKGRDEKADQRQDPASVLQAPLLGSIPDFKALGVAGAAPTIDDPRSPAAESYQFVIASLTRQMRTREASCILVTSPLPNDGKTITALNLAIAASRDGREVLLVDADARVKGLSRLLDASDGAGLHELQQDPDNLVWTQSRREVGGTDSLELVPSGSDVPDPAGFFRTHGFESAMRRIRDYADLVLIDSPPMLAVSDAAAVAAYVDGIVLVVSQGTPLSVLQEVQQRLALIDAPLMGYVFNRASARTAPYSYYRYEPEPDKAKKPRKTQSTARVTVRDPKPRASITTGMSTTTRAPSPDALDSRQW